MSFSTLSHAPSELHPRPFNDDRNPAPCPLAARPSPPYHTNLPIIRPQVHFLPVLSLLSPSPLIMLLPRPLPPLPLLPTQTRSILLIMRLLPPIILHHIQSLSHLPLYLLIPFMLHILKRHMLLIEAFQEVCLAGRGLEDNRGS